MDGKFPLGRNNACGSRHRNHHISSNSVRWEALLFPFYRWRKLKRLSCLYRSHCQGVAELGFEPTPLRLQSLHAQTFMVGGIEDLSLECRLNCKMMT